MISATRHTVASTATASPASRRAMSILRPYSSVRPSRANRRARSASVFSSCRAGSASMILASATSSTRPAGLGRDHPRHGRVDQADRVGVQVARKLGDAARDPHLALPAQAHRPCQGQPVLQVEHVGEGIARRHHPGAAGQGDLAEAEVLHTRSAVTADLDQHVAQASGRSPVRPLGRITRVHRRPLRQHLQVVHLSPPPYLHGLRRPGEEPGCVEVLRGGRSCVRFYRTTTDTRKPCVMSQDMGDSSASGHR